MKTNKKKKMHQINTVPMYLSGFTSFFYLGLRLQILPVLNKFLGKEINNYNILQNYW